MIATPCDIWLGFDFYGAGNVGDDLMLEGFLKVFSVNSWLPLTCSLSADRIGAQKRRFSQIRWVSFSSEERKSALACFGDWLGVGGTPFQASSGQWLLRKMASDFESSEHHRKWFIGVGCEEEVLKERTLAQQIAKAADLIWARDLD